MTKNVCCLLQTACCLITAFLAPVLPAARVTNGRAVASRAFYLPLVLANANPTNLLPSPSASAPTPIPPASTPITTPATLPFPAAEREWLAAVNSYRALATLPPITENATWSAEDVLHSTYLVRNDVVAHTEDASKPLYSDAGQRAGQNGNVMGTSVMEETDREAVDAWMTAPFHALQMLDPRWQQGGFGSYRESTSTLAQSGGAFDVRMAATLDTIRGKTGSSSATTFPIMWPGNGATTPLTMFNGSELPDPLTSCPGYSAPTGAPIYFQLGSGVRPAVVHATVTQGALAVPSCTFDQTSYVSPDSNQQQLARDILNAQHAIVIIPRQPLTPGATYTVAVTTNGATYSWSFNVKSTASSCGDGCEDVESFGEAR